VVTESRSPRTGTLKNRVHHALEVEDDDRGFERALNLGLLALIVVNVVAVILETVPSIQERFETAFDVLEALSIGVFTLEYTLRLWSCTEDSRYQGAIRGRLRFLLSPLALVDLAAIVPAYLPGEVFLDLRYARIVRLIRMMRLLKMSRYSTTVRTFVRVAEAKRGDLGLISVLLLVLLVLASSSMYFVEHRVQPAVYSSIPASMWWAIETMTTVGYGDMVPMTPLGKFLGSTIALIGIGFFALPTGVLAAAFAEEIAKPKAGKGACPQCGQPMPSERQLARQRADAS
jgi:voltage-gated potassium channel